MIINCEIFKSYGQTKLTYQEMEIMPKRNIFGTGTRTKSIFYFTKISERPKALKL